MRTIEELHKAAYTIEHTLRVNFSQNPSMSIAPDRIPATEALAEEELQHMLYFWAVYCLQHIQELFITIRRTNPSFPITHLPLPADLRFSSELRNDLRGQVADDMLIYYVSASKKNPLPNDLAAAALQDAANANLLQMTIDAFKKEECSITYSTDWKHGLYQHRLVRHPHDARDEAVYVTQADQYETLRYHRAIHEILTTLTQLQVSNIPVVPSPLPENRYVAEELLYSLLSALWGHYVPEVEYRHITCKITASTVICTYNLPEPTTLSFDREDLRYALQEEAIKAYRHKLESYYAVVKRNPSHAQDGSYPKPEEGHHEWGAEHEKTTLSQLLMEFTNKGLRVGNSDDIDATYIKQRAAHFMGR